MKVSYYNFKRMHDFLRDDISAELNELFSLDNYPKLNSYRRNNEEEIGKLLGDGYYLGTQSGTAALQLTLTALGISKGDEVITTPYTFIATLLAISNVGAKPVLVDISKDTMLLDTDKIEDKITKKTKVLMPVHIYGQMLDMAKIGKIAKKNGLIVIEDACQAHLARYDGKMPGTYSDAACYSFSPPKILGSVGDGGMIITKRKKISNSIDILRNPRGNDPSLLKSLRTPAYLNYAQIALLKPQLKYIRKWVNKRREIANIYRKELSELPLILPGEDKNAYHVYLDFVILTRTRLIRNVLKRYLQVRGIEIIPNYFPLPHLTSTFSYLGYKEGDLPVAEGISDKALSLPTSPFLTNKEIDYIIKCIRSFFRYNVLA